MTGLEVVNYQPGSDDYAWAFGGTPAGFEARQTITPDAHGGNMDSTELRAGTTAYFAVNHDGALFALGDGHCRQGEGEVCGTAVEAAMNTVIAVDLVKGGTPTPWPRLETDDAVMSTGSTRPLEDAYRVRGLRRRTRQVAVRGSRLSRVALTGRSRPTIVC